MAPFNKRQIGYIQAIAGRQQHVTLTAGTVNHMLHGFRQPTNGSTIADDIQFQDKPQVLDSNRVYGCGGGGSYLDAKSLLLQTYHLAPREYGFDSRPVHNDDQLQSYDFANMELVGYGTGNHTILGIGNNPATPKGVFHAPVRGSHYLFDDHGNGPSGGQHTGGAAGVHGELVRNPELIPSDVRATEDGYLNSTTVFFRFTLPTYSYDGGDVAGASGTSHLNSQVNSNPMGQQHFEFRWIVFRSKKPVIGEWEDANQTNLEQIRNGASFRNYSYDLFMGQTGRKRGLLGYCHNANLDKEVKPALTDSERYSGKRYITGNGAFADGDGTDTTLNDVFNTKGSDSLLTVDDLMTMRLNRDDYVVQKDVRFFLGKEHGKSHFEDTLHWDWNDPIETPSDDVLTSPTLNNKNYRWKMMLIGTNGGKSAPVTLLSHVRWTTKMESG